MNFDYSYYTNTIKPVSMTNLGTTYYSRPNTTFSPNRNLIGSDRQFNRRTSPVRYFDHSPYFLEFENDELAHSLFEEKRANRELLSILDSNKYELEKISKNYDSKIDEYNALARKYEQSEQIRSQQASLIGSLENELKELREKVKNMELEQKEDEDEVESVKDSKTSKKTATTKKEENVFKKNLASNANEKPKKNTVDNSKKEKSKPKPAVKKTR